MVSRVFEASGRAVAIAGVVGAAACGQGSESPAAAVDASADEIVVQDTAFTGFCNWSSAPAMAAGDASDGIHGLGALKVYWNQSPAHGATSFAPGTIIVKESQQADATQRVVFAMVKRGGTFNADGAKGWEWWSLVDNGDCTMTRLWRAAAAPAGETYANMAAGDCNGCHGIVADNDYVWDTALQLSKF